VAAVLAEVLETLRVSMRECGAEITWDPLPAVPCDRLHVIQLFQNLLSNAVKYRGTEPPRVHVSAERRGGEWLFAVRDNGIGISDGQQELIFEIFKRLHDRKGIAGTGIGLAICQRVVQRYQGRIWVESKAGQGSTFYFTLPCA
jgi:light-regulated signal transduction histidine kinase (bacteriophytochrome)